jgi:hypothetical protein
MRSSYKTVAFWITFPTLMGCSTTLSPKAAILTEADDKMVQNCEFVGTYEGGSGWGNLAQGTGMKNSKNEVFEEAADHGATHVVFNSISGGYAPFASGRAYKCRKP